MMPIYGRMGHADAKGLFWMLAYFAVVVGGGAYFFGETGFVIGLFVFILGMILSI